MENVADVSVNCKKKNKKNKSKLNDGQCSRLSCLSHRVLWALSAPRQRVDFKWCGCKGGVESLLWCWCLQGKPRGRNRKCETAAPHLTSASRRPDSWRRQPCLSPAPAGWTEGTGPWGQWQYLENRLKLWIRDDSYPGWEGWPAVPTASWPPEGFQAPQGWDMLCWFLVFIRLIAPVHRQLGHVHHEEIRERFHAVGEATCRCEDTRRRSRLFLKMLRNFDRWICREMVSDVKSSKKTMYFKTGEFHPPPSGFFCFCRVPVIWCKRAACLRQIDFSWRNCWYNSR